ncbi:hypothetical protein EVAR_51901_1 [Eumeta japonica]|uniref:Uncharacterized protein n=1 Tax=Eumeta variegata TaxID=151549 RepID=A0A4C1XKB7_EUMVA|nr:hypothetical protein EVAR_51901_1 [Eumeta japonica]
MLKSNAILNPERGFLSGVKSNRSLLASLGYLSYRSCVSSSRRRRWSSGVPDSRRAWSAFEAQLLRSEKEFVRGDVIGTFPNSIIPYGCRPTCPTDRANAIVRGPGGRHLAGGRREKATGGNTEEMTICAPAPAAPPVGGPAPALRYGARCAGDILGGLLG